MIELRFTKPTALHTNPIVLRFGGVPVEPEVNWLCQLAGLNTQMARPTSANTHALRTGRLQAIATASQQQWQHLGCVMQQASVASASLTLLQNRVLMRNKGLAPIERHVHLRANTLTPTQRAWQLVFNQGGTLTKTISSRVALGEVRVNQFVLQHGPTAPSAFCVPVNHPRPGKVVLRFRDTTPTNLTLRFRAVEKVCVANATGLLSALNEQPVLNSKLPITPQIANTYMSQPIISCERVSDGQVIYLASFSYTLSRDQFAASVSLAFQTKTDAMRAHNNLLRVTVNGYDFYVLSEQPSSNMSFTGQSFASQGRSRLAELSSPYRRDATYTNTVAKTLAGIMAELLTGTDWQLFFSMVDYNVPANTVTIANKAPASALLHCAKAIGGMLQVDDALKKITVVPRWPTSPWLVADAVCDIVLHESHIDSFSEQLREQSSANAVFISGQQNGVSCKVKRDGSQGDLLLNDVVDSLITHNQAARQRGSCELANAGSENTISISTDLTAQIPLIKPGALVGVQFSDVLLKATCHSVTINAQVQSNGAIDVSQQLQLVEKV